MAISSHDIVPDSPTNTFATLNPLSWVNLGGANSAQNLSEGNLKLVASGTEGSGELSSILPSKTGINKVYFEAKGVGSSSATNGYIAIFDENGSNLNPTNVHRQVGQNEIVSWVIDVSEGKLWRQSNGGWSAARKTEIENGQNPDLSFTCTSDILEIWFSTYTTDRGMVINFGQDQTFAGTASGGGGYQDANGIGQFYYDPPTGALALCTANLPDFTPTVTDDTPQDYFKAVIWGGNNQSGRQIDTDGIGKGTGFQPDIVWVAIRSGQLSVQTITDSVRQVDSILSPNGTYSVNTFDASWRSSYGQITIFNSTGFQVNKGSATSSNFNSSNEQYVAWCWKAGGPPDLTSSPTKPFAKNGVQYETLSAANITAGTITPTAMSVNTDAGFSIVSWSAPAASQTVGHGLSKRPDLIISKKLDISSAWAVYQDFSGSMQYLALNSTNAAISAGFNMNSTTISGITNDTTNVIAYCWHSVEGYSKFGSYTGNGSTSGNEPFVYTGFKPAWVMIKETGNSGSWHIYDNSRPNYNPASYLLANESSQEDAYGSYGIDILSNGYKVRNNGNGTNRPSGTFIYAAFAEMPFKYATAR